jgi:hypothetical protein
MPQFEVRVAEALDAPPRVEPNDPTPELRTLICKVDAADEDAAAKRETWAHIWEAKYGLGRLPVHAIVEVTPLSDT